MLEIWLSQENCPKSLERRSLPCTNKEKDTKKIGKALNVPRDTVGSIVCKFKVKGTVATLPGRGRKRKLSTAATRFLRRQVAKNP